MDGGKPVLGLMNQPFTGERFWSDGRPRAWRVPDGKARRSNTRACARLGEAVLTSDAPRHVRSAPTSWPPSSASRARARMTRYGGDCYGYCLLAAGFIDLVVEAGLKAYDIVALVPIIEGAGGRVTTWEGEPATDGGRIVAAGDARVHEGGAGVLSWLS